ncbi:helix-hairpin-helix domain-containing protein [Peptoniphilus sp. KCTC 25270]|uniref:helix-hairpin-helix domain-containing protein n=1 Tax=Peptoniphilus sp. KCTC 25270 TaxID=2897414 RepID=UPI001E5C70D8|nr:Tex-like N-terminal domain-containing protein [Peptoniphilus sp. KCTC 25270]MCD1146689.1 helix-hairpin-helix domain-containing protein [Peptoniphilus sp. KCTC 25270]
MNITNRLAEEFQRTPEVMESILALFDEGNTIPFVARYRKEVTRNMEDETLRALTERRNLLVSLEERKATIVKTLMEQENLTEKIQEDLDKAETMAELEDIYRPYKPKKRTRATIAKEKGLEPFAMEFLSNHTMEKFEHALETAELEEELSYEEKLQGVKDIVAEIYQDNATVRMILKKFLKRNAVFYTEAGKVEDATFAMYFDRKEKYSRAQNHRILAMDRGEKLGALKVSLQAEEEVLISLILQVFRPQEDKKEMAKEIAKDSLKRLIFPSVERELRGEKTEEAQKSAIEVFGKNLRPLLLSPPLRNARILAIDPGVRTGCKVAILDEYGLYLENSILYLNDKKGEERAKKILPELLKKYKIDAIAIGSGTASYETELFVSTVLKENKMDVEYAIVNEDGASVYSASPLAKEEFPDLDVTVRGAISIGRRLQDPLAELVKIEPRHIGVGQYQHDLDRKSLDEKLSGVIEACVNHVGVNINTASVPLLSHISGITKKTAQNIVDYRNENGPFENRKQIKDVKGIGPKAFEQAAGFLRIPESTEILDNTGVHPESYEIARILMNEELSNSEKAEKIKALDVGELTLEDIKKELEKPGRDVREDLGNVALKRTAMEMKDLKEGLKLQGVVRNVVDFGAFVDIGIKKSGLLHIGKILEKRGGGSIYDKVEVGESLEVEIITLDLERERIALALV